MNPLILPWRGVTPTIAADAFIAPNATVIGDVQIGARSSVWFNCVLRADVCSIRIGARTNIQDGTVVHESSAPLPTLIGDDVLVGHLAILHACTLEDGCFVGMRATVMDGAVVERGAMVAAGALIGPGKRVPTGELWAGSPARFMRKLTEAEIAGFKPATDGYAALADEYRAMLATIAG
jgi:carbonic anhydrase/acetyltransferase-like protein (isoleucine patch superfamily)